MVTAICAVPRSVLLCVTGGMGISALYPWALMKLSACLKADLMGSPCPIPSSWYPANGSGSGAGPYCRLHVSSDSHGTWLLSCILSPAFCAILYTTGLQGSVTAGLGNETAVTFPEFSFCKISRHSGIPDRPFCLTYSKYPGNFPLP